MNISQARTDAQSAISRFQNIATRALSLDQTKHDSDPAKDSIALKDAACPESMEEKWDRFWGGEERQKLSGTIKTDTQHNPVSGQITVAKTAHEDTYTWKSESDGRKLLVLEESSLFGALKETTTVVTDANGRLLQMETFQETVAGRTVPQTTVF